MARYNDIKLESNIKSNGIRGNRYYKSSKYPQITPSINDTYVYAEEGDRYDQLAANYYGDSSLWWIISIANESFNQNSYYPPLGVQIRIPSNVGAIKSSYNKLNNRNEL